MNNTPKVSIIVPAYNCVKYIPETLASLFEQDYANIEILVVNDGSTDDTLQLLKTYGDKIILIDQANTGVPGARNKGIQAAQGQFICFCDSDDLWAPGKVREQVCYLSDHPNVGMVYCDWLVWEPDGDGKFILPGDFKAPKINGQEIDPVKSGWIYHKLLLDCICLTSAVMFRKEIIDEIGLFDVNLWNGDDYDYWLRASRITEIHKLKPQFVLYRILPFSLTRTLSCVHYEYKVLSNAIGRWGTVGPNGEQNSAQAMTDRLASLRFSFGYLHLNSGDARIAVGSFYESILQKPLWYLPWAYLLLGLWKYASKAVAYR